MGSAEASWCAPDPLEVGFPATGGFPQENFYGKPTRVNWSVSDPSQVKGTTKWQRTDFFVNNSIYKTIYYLDSSKTTYLYQYKKSQPVGGAWKQTRLPVMELFEEKSAAQFSLSLEQHDLKNTSTSPLQATYDQKQRPSILTSFLLPISALGEIPVRYSCRYNNDKSITETEDTIINGMVINTTEAQITLNLAGQLLKKVIFSKSPRESQATFLEETVYTYNTQGEWVGTVSRDERGTTLSTSKVSMNTKGQISQLQSYADGKVHLRKFTYDARGNWIGVIYSSEGQTRLSIQRTITY